MRRLLPLRVRLWWERAFWVPPTLGVLVGLALELTVGLLDAQLEPLAPSGLSAGAATGVLSAIGGGMVTFTGFVFSFVVLLLQFGSTQYSPRTVAYFVRARSTQVILAVFLLTITFTFLSLVGVGRDTAPALAVVVSVLLLLVSLVAFIALLHLVGRRIRVDAVLSSLGRRARSQVVRQPDAPPQVAAEQDERPATPVRHTGASGQVIAVDARRLRRLAQRHETNIELGVQVGDGVASGAVVASCRPQPVPALARAVARCVVVDAERSLEGDPLYSLRLLVDIALRALSPGINDPTTAVRALTEIEQVLRVAAERPLGPRTIGDARGRVRLLAPTWSDVVELALAEVVVVGAGQPQVTRRLLALLDDVVNDVDPEHRPPLEAARSRLVAAVARAGGDDLALVPDRQGLGAARRTGAADDPRGTGHNGSVPTRTGDLQP